MKETSLAVMMLTSVACSSSTLPTTSVNGGAGSGGSPGASGKELSPATLRQFESGAEAMSEVVRGVLPAHVPDWTTAQDAYSADFQLWQGVKPSVLAAGAKASTMIAIEAALAAYAMDVARQAQRDAETDANKITLAIPDLFDLFAYPAPTDTLRLDGTFRQLQIGAEYSDGMECRTWLEQTRTVWNTLRPMVQAQAPSRPDVTGSVTIIADVDSNLQTIDALIGTDGGVMGNSVQLETQAQEGLDQTDTCEQIFK